MALSCVVPHSYLRDIAFDYKYVAESFETSCPHSCVDDLCRNVKDRLRAVCTAEGVRGDPYLSCRVTQLYDTGACIYFYFGFLYEVSVDRQSLHGGGAPQSSPPPRHCSLSRGWCATCTTLLRHRGLNPATYRCLTFSISRQPQGLADPMATFHKVEVAARGECIANGGSISHHHGGVLQRAPAT